MSPSSLRALAVAAVLGAALAECGQSPSAGAPDGVPPNAIIESDRFTGVYDLVDTDGARVTQETAAGDVRIFYFGFARCPDVCPLALGTMSAALDVLSDAERARVGAYFVTVDPEHDTTEELKAFLSFDENIRGLTGNADQIEAAKAGFLVFARREEDPDFPGGYRMSHSSFFYLADETGRPLYAVRDSVSPDELASILRRNI
ncbi:MAG: SCO family protein [Pseudomonadota bacterium]